MTAVLSLEGEPGRERLEETFQKLIQRHESFRTSFHMMDNEPVQRTHEKVEFEMEYCEVEVKEEEQKTEDRRQKTEEKQKTTGDRPSSYLSSVIRHLSSEFIRPFELSRAPLLRVGLIKLPHTPAALRDHPSQEGKEPKYILIVDMHHIISDGTSLGIFIDDFIALYSGKTLPELPIHYKDYTQWQEQIKDSEFMKQQEEYWLNELEGELVELNLPHDFPRPEIRQFHCNKKQHCMWLCWQW
jgi:hypothetical protein